MIFAAIVSGLHVLALAIGLPAIFWRGRALRAPLDAAGLGRLFVADNVWGLAALLWIVTGLLRAFGGLEKGASFYVHSRLFWLKLALFALIVVLELWPMITFIRWRREQRRGRLPDTTNARRLYAITHAEMALVLVIVFVAAFVARGF